MPLRRKIALIVGAAFCGLLLLMYLFARLILLDSFAQLERDNANRNMERVVYALDGKLDNLVATTTDWAYWDDTYDFIGDGNDDYKIANLSDSTFDTLNLNVMLFVDNSNQLVFGKAYDLISAQEEPIPAGLYAQFASRLVMPNADTSSLRRGVLMLPDGPMLVVSRPILNSAEQGPAKGTLIFGQSLDQAQVAHLAESTRLSLTMYSWADTSLSADVRAASGTLSAASPQTVRTLSHSALAGYAMLPDIYGNPALIFRAELPRNIYAQGQRALTFFMAVTLGIGLLTGVVLLVLLEKTVLAKAQMGAVLEHSSDIIILTNAEGSIQRVNPTFRRTFNGLSNHFDDQPLSALFDDTLATPILNKLHAVVETAQNEQIDVDLLTQSGNSIHMNMALSPIQAGSGPVSGVLCSLRDITAHKRLEEQLHQTLARETELNELKTRFVSIASHELRTPLAVIRMSSDVLFKYSDRLTESQRDKELRQLQIEVTRMVDLLDDVLILSQAEASTFTLAPTEVDLTVLCNDVIARIQKLTGSSPRVLLEVSGQSSPMMLDPKLITHVINNLLSNAVKYSPPRSPVTLALNYEPNQVILQVTDHGIGIPDDDQVRLFEAFFRATNVGSAPGTGLGLAIVKQAVEVHGGTIACKSRVGIGTTFTVTLPGIY